MSSGNSFSKNRQFATTHWSVVRSVGDSDGETAKSALEKLCKTYWYPLYSFVRHLGHNADEASDLTQAFFADLLEREDLKRVDPNFGKFRSFLLASVKNFIANHWKREKALKRGGGQLIGSLEFSFADSRFRESLVSQPHDSSQKTPDQLFERHWAETLLKRVQQKLQKEFEQKGKSHQYERLAQFLAGKSNDGTIRQVSSELSMTEVAAKVAVHRMRRRFGDLLREEIVETLENPEEIDAEINHLFSVLKN